MQFVQNLIFHVELYFIGKRNTNGIKRDLKKAENKSYSIVSC